MLKDPRIFVQVIHCNFPANVAFFSFKNSLFPFWKFVIYGLPLLADLALCISCSYSLATSFQPLLLFLWGVLHICLLFFRVFLKFCSLHEICVIEGEWRYLFPTPYWFISFLAKLYPALSKMLEHISDLIFALY